MTATTKKKQRQQKTQPTNLKRSAVIEHLYELRRRIIYIVATIFVGATGAYFVQQKIVHFLLLPSHHQQFIYTSPGGGIGFLFEVCTYIGILLAIPVAVVQIVAFLTPVMQGHTRSWILRSALWSGVLALAGLALGYYIGLPAALRFLGNQFTTNQIKPLFTIQEYLNFITFYLVGSALLFQLPLILMVINRIKPLKPQTLLKGERYVIVAAFIISMLMAPTVNILNQLIIAVPVIAMYQVGIMLVWFKNRPHKTKQISEAPVPETLAPATFAQSAKVPNPIPEPPTPRTIPLASTSNRSLEPVMSRQLPRPADRTQGIQQTIEQDNEGLTGEVLFGLLARRNQQGDSYGPLNQPMS